MHMEAGRLFSRDFHLTDNLHPSAEKEVSIPHNRYPRSIGSCKGIVCLMDSASLKSCVFLNPFNITYQKVKCRNTCHIWNSFGFGYDCATDDYKIVVWKTYEHSIHQYLDVYSMRRDSWKHVIREFSPSCSPQVNGICVEGAIHWKGINENRNGCSCIVAFDLETEVLRSLPLPHHLIAIAIGQPWSLHDLGGRLCVIVKSLFGSIIVSVMEEYVETSWTQLFDFGSAFILWHFPTWDNLVLLWLESDLRTLSWFNTKRGSMEDIHIHKVPHRQGNKQTWNESQSWVCVRSPLRLRCS